MTEKNIFEELKHTPEGIDFMSDAWVGCVRWAIGKREMRDAFKSDTGFDIDRLLTRTPVEAMFDEATGLDRDLLLKFCDWVTENVWGIQGQLHEND